jgi:tetratricopeptide (TPR) repeat protein
MGTLPVALAQTRSRSMKRIGRELRLALALIAALANGSLAAEPTLLEQGRAAMNRGDGDAAVAFMEKAVAAAPNSAETHCGLASAYGIKVQQGGMMVAVQFAARIREEFEKTVALDPKHVEARYGLVQLYAGAPPMMGGSYEKALEQAQAIKALDPVVGHRAYAFVYAQQKQLDQARKEYADAIREQPKSAKAHSFFGQYLVNTEKNYPAAFAEFEAALKVDSTYAAALYHIGRTAAIADSNLARGEESLRKYLGHAPRENEPPLANANYHLGAVHEKQGRKAEAKKNYEDALKLNPTLKDATEALKRVAP